jgi:hypothetical protein
MLALVGILVVVLALGLGLFSGELARMKKDPEFQKQLEEEKKENERKKVWKDKLKG